MNNPTPQPHGLRRCAGGRADRRGSAILLVLVSMVLMAILAGSLLQLTRFERIPRSESNIEVVIASVIDEILIQATEDLLDNDGNYLNTQYTTAAGGNGGGDEPFDLPWTNPSTAFGMTVEYNDGTTIITNEPVSGGVMDDSWIADHMPDFRTTVGAAANQIQTNSLYASGGVDTTGFGVWRKITSLNKVYLGGANGSSDLSSRAIPNEYPVNFNDVFRRDMNIPTTQTVTGGDLLLVDADGDGIGDSRWEWAPLRRVGATEYVMAVRIIDLSARMDMNVATRIHGDTGPSATSFTGANLGAGLPRGDSPAELDGSGFVADTADSAAAINGTQARAEWLDVLRHRLTGDGAVTPTGGVFPNYDGNTDPPTLGSRRDYWTKGASRVSNTFGRNGEDPSGSLDYSSGSTFGFKDAFELLHGNGLNSSNTTTIETLMPAFLRGTATPEDGYAVGAGTNQPNNWTVKQFWELDPRKNVTMFSGSAVTVKPTTVAQGRQLKIDINEAFQTALGQLRNRITDFLNDSNSGSLLALFPHVNAVGAFSNQFTANIADYIDEDNLLTTVSSRTGFEALPYITEVYTQRLYEGLASASGTVGTNNVAWTEAGAQGYALEIANPFARYDGANWVGRPIKLTDVYLRFNGGTAYQLSDYYPGTVDELMPGEVLYLYRDSDGADGDATLHDLSTYDQTVTATTNYTNVIRAEGPALPTGAALEEITFSLHATLQGGSSAETWAYNACVVAVGDDDLGSEPLSATDFLDGETYFSFVQTSYQGVGEGLQMMTVMANPSDTNGYDEDRSSLDAPSGNTDSGPMGTRAAERPALGDFSNESKSREPAGFGLLDGQQIVWPDSDRERIHWVGDLLQIPIIGPNRAGSGTTTTMAQAFAAAAAAPGRLNTDGIDALYLPYQRYSATVAAPVVDNEVTANDGTGRFGIYNYPHALLLLEQFTTFSPASDGENGDGSNPAAPSGEDTVASPNESEVLVPGKLNLNTAPRETLIRLLPFPDMTTRENVADAIIARRESITQNTGTVSYGTGANGIPGIAYTTALYEQIEPLVNPGGQTTTYGTSGIRVDLNDYEDALGDFDPLTAGIDYTGLEDGVADDREEKIMLAKWLTEMTETRSDVFAAYIVVQGYPADNFTEGATESARLIIIFSRANVGTTGDKAVEIGRFRIN